MNNIAVKKGQPSIERHDLANSITEIITNNRLSFDEAESVLQLARHKIGRLILTKELAELKRQLEERPIQEDDLKTGTIRYF